MRRGTRNYLLICGAMVGIGVIFAIIGFISGGLHRLPDLEQRYDWIDFGGGRMVAVTEVRELEPFSDIDIDCRFSTVRLIPDEKAKTYRAEVTFNEKDGKPEFQSKDGKLSVSDKNAGNHYAVSLNFFGRSPEYGALNIYYPKKKDLDNVNINCDMGDVDLSGIDAERVTIRCGSGEVNLEEVTSDFLEVKADMGSIKGTDLRTRGMDIGVQSGEIDLDGLFRGKNKVSCDTGSCRVRTKLPQSAYSIDTRIDVGEVNIGNETVSGGYKEKVENSNAKNSFALSCDYGEITLDFI